LLRQIRRLAGDGAARDLIIVLFSLVSVLLKLRAAALPQAAPPPFF
jgi:hypothetical protein